MNKIVFFKIKELIVFFDQAIVSLCNFLIGFFLLKYIGLIDFGIFSIIWFTQYLINSLQMSFFINILNTTQHSTFKKQIFFNTTIFYCQILFTIILILLFLFILPFVFDFLKINDVNHYLIIFFFSVFQLSNFLKRIFYKNNFYSFSLTINLIIYLGSLIFIFLLKNNNILSLENFFYSASFLCLISIFIFLNNLKKFISFSKRNINHFYEIWNYSKWLGLSSIMNFFCLNVWQFYLASNISITLLGVFRACSNLSSFLNVFFQAFENIFPKKFSKIINKNSTGVSMLKYNFRFIKEVIIILAPFILISIFFSKEILFLVYKNELIVNYNYIYIITLLIVSISIFRYPIEYSLRSINSTKILFVSNLIPALLALFFSNLIILKFGINGFLFGAFLNQLLLTFLPIILFYIKHIKLND